MKLKIYIIFSLSLMIIGITNNCINAQGKEVDNFRKLIKNNEQENPLTLQKLEWLQLRNPATDRIPMNIREKELRYAKTLPSKEDMTIQKDKNGGSEYVQKYSWQQIGPYNIGGRTRALAIDINDENTILAGGVNGGMWKSTDDGASWKETTSPSDIQSVTCLTQDIRPGKTNTWYYGTGEFNYIPTTNFVNTSSGGPGYDSSLMFLGNGIFKSTDNGNSWFVLPSTETSPEKSIGQFSIVYNIVTNPPNQNQDEVLAATFGGIMRSTDGGTTWDTTLPNLYGIYSNIAVTSKGVFYAVLNYGAFPIFGGIFRSTDGVNWTNITPDNFPFNTTQTAIAVAPSNEDVVYFLSDTSNYDSYTDGHMLWKYTYLSGNGTGTGGNWINRSKNLPSQGTNMLDRDSNYGWALCLGVKPDDENTVFMGEIGLFRSTDGFASKNNIAVIGDTVSYKPPIQYKNLHVDNHAIVFSRTNPNVMYVGNDGGVFKSENIMDAKPTWMSLNNGYFTTQFYSVAVNHNSLDNIIIAGAQDNGTIYTNSNSVTSSWKKIGDGDGLTCAIANEENSYYTSSQFGTTDRLELDDNGNIISRRSIEPPYNLSDIPFVNEPYVLDPNNNNVIYYAQAEYIWRNSDVTTIPINNPYGTTDVNWTKLTNTSTGYGSNITAIGISKTPADRIYYGTEDGKILRLDNANSSNSVPVDIYTNKGLPSGAYAFCIAVDQSDGNKAILSFSNYYVKSLFYTTDAGNTWTSIAGNLEQYSDGSGNGPSTRWVKILPVNGTDIYFVGTSTGVYSTTSLNGDKTIWALEGANTIGNAVVDAIDARATDGLVVVATHGKGIFSTNVLADTSSGSSNILVKSDNNLIPQSGIYASNKNNSIIADRLTAPVSTFKITKLIYYITNDNANGNGSFYPFEDACVNLNGVLTPAKYGFLENIYTPSTINGWDTVDISASAIHVNPSPNYVDKEFFVGVSYDGIHQPAIGYDSTSSNSRGWYYDPTNQKWMSLDNMGWHITLYIRAEISTVTEVVDINTKVPNNFNLFQNYPNPFNPSTTIEYDLPKNENVKLKVFNILGREVATLVDANQAPGQYRITWNGRNNSRLPVASGIYLYSFEAGNYKAVKKMIYLK